MEENKCRLKSLLENIIAIVFFLFMVIVVLPWFIQGLQEIPIK